MFSTKRDAEKCLTIVESEVLRGDWVDPLLSKITLAVYGTQWIKDRKLGVRTREEYERQFRLHVSPFLGEAELGAISTEVVRKWRTTLLDADRSENATAKAYRLLRAIMHAAYDDGRVKRNPCRIT